MTSSTRHPVLPGRLTLATAARAWGVSILLSSLLGAPAWADTTLRAALDKAWERAVQARVAESRTAQADASRTAATSWFADAPAIGLAEKSDRVDRNRGARERELDLALPLWLPGQRAARQAYASSDAADAEAGVAAARLALAGELRAAVWNLAAAGAEEELAAERLATAEQLQADVARRHKAGDLARTDLLLTQEETLTAKAALAEARTRARQALGRLRALTGRDSMPGAIEEAAAAPAADPHPRVASAHAAVALARAGLRLTREERRDPPELAIGVVQTRDESAGPSNNALRIGLRLPFGTDGRNAPKLAAANAVLIKAEAELRQALAEIEIEQSDAQAALENAEVVHQAAQSRAALAGERLSLQQKAFSLGELSLAEFMRMRATATQARLEQGRARVALGAARAQLNQARGLLP